jgi:hypothetical protein
MYHAVILHRQYTLIKIAESGIQQNEINANTTLKQLKLNGIQKMGCLKKPADKLLGKKIHEQQ